MEEILVLGLDGLDGNLVNSFSENLQYLDGISRNQFESILPPITNPAWPCSFTGKRPERFDRFDFQSIDHGKYDFTPRKNDVYSPDGFWNFTDSKVVMSDVPGMDVQEIDGCVVGGLFDVSEESTYPSTLSSEMQEELGDYQVEPLTNYDSEEDRRDMAFEFFEKRKRVLNYLLENKDADVYFQVFRLPDTMMHHSDNDEQMRKAYRKCDEYLGELMERDDLSIIVVSDHGAVKATKRFSINTWLKKNGYLKQKEGSEKSFFEKLAFKVGEVAERAGFRDYLVWLNEKYSEYRGEAFVQGNLALDSVEWRNTEAFSYMTGVCGYAGIWINDDRFPNPAVDDRQAKKEEIKEELEKHELVDEVMLKEKAFVEDAESFPDLVVDFAHKVKNDSDIKPDVTGKISSYMHRKEGFLGVHGPDLELNEENGELIDLAPTILHYLGEEIPEEMDGKVMDIFDDDSEPGQRDPEYTSSDIAGIDI
jgi:predicted AlkP superfamily phosphohydrolase/phosphomutase